MDSSQITLMIEALTEKRKKPAKEVADIDAILLDLRSQLNHRENAKTILAPVLDIPVVVSNPQDLTIFPSSSSLQTQILAALDLAKRPLKMTEIGDTIYKQTGQSIDVRETVRGMNKNYKIVLMKINNSNKMSFWIKPEWYDREKKFIKDEYKLENMDIMYEKENVEFIGVKK